MHKRLYSAFAVILIGMALLCACRKQETTDAGIRIEVGEVTAPDGTVIQIPEFVTESEEVKKNLRDLDREVRLLRKTAEKEQKRGTCPEMRCYVYEVKNYPQVTVVWKIRGEASYTCNLVTLCADEKKGMPVTCKEALEQTGMTGVDLSLNVGRLAREANVPGQLRSTEMQGFRIGENGNVSEMYMKLNLEVEQDGEKAGEERFFSYMPEEDRLVPLSERGFNVP